MSHRADRSPTGVRRLAAHACAALALLLAARSAVADAPAAARPEPAPAASATASAAESSTAAVAPDEPLPEVEIVGERPGPGLWRVSDGNHALYILGTYRPLPKKMTWRSREVEDVLARAQLLIPESPDVDADVGLFQAVKLYTQWRRVRKAPDGAPLSETLPPDLYARFESLRAKHAPRSRDLLKLRPVLAAAELWSDALERQDLELGIDVEKSLRKRAKKLKVEIANPIVKLDDPKGLLDEFAEIPRDAELACVRATLDRLETDLATARELASAWATGDVDLLRERQVWLGQQACFESLTRGPRLEKMRRDFEAVWLDTVLDALRTREVALAIAPMSRLLGKDGVLAEFARRGYAVETP